MYYMKTKRKTSDERKTEALEAAQQIIYEEGFYNLTIRKIAEKLNVSEAALYRHFNDKEDIIDKLTDLIFFEACVIDKNDKNPIEIFKDFIYKQAEKFEGNPYLSIISFQEDMFREYPNIKEKFTKHQKEREKEIINIINKGIEVGEIRRDINPSAFASIFMGSIRITVLKWKNNDFSYSLKEKLEEVNQELINYLKGDN